MKKKFMDSKLGKWIKRIVVILIVLGLVVFGVFKSTRLRDISPVQ